MVQHATQYIFTIGRLHSQLDRFGDGCSQASLIIRVLGDNVAARTCTHTGRGDHLGSERLHDRTAVGFLVVADLYHIDSQFQSEMFGGHSHGSSPLSGACFGRDIGHAFLFAEIGLRNSGIQFMRSDRADTFVLEVDVSRRVECFFKSVSADQRSRTPDFIHVANFFRDFDPGIRLVHLLVYQSFGK